MPRMIETVRVVGLGKVGELVATLLVDAGFAVTAFDARLRKDLPDLSFAVDSLDVRDGEALRAALKGADAVVSCMPYNLNLPVAEAAHEVGLHYFDLTEDVPTTQRVMQLAATNPSHVLAPQHRAEGGGAPPPSGRTARLCVQLVRRGRRQRVPQRL